MRCECLDKSCPPHIGQSCRNTACHTVYRCDMLDVTGLRFCSPCTDDAIRTGFYSESPITTPSRDS